LFVSLFFFTNKTIILIIKNLNKGEFYKYLGINQSNHIQHSIIKENLEKQYYLRIKSILKSKLNGNNLIKAVNTYAVPLLTYSLSSPANSSNAVARNQMLEINCSKMKLLDCNFSRNTSSSNCNFSKMFCSNLYGRKCVIGV
jgi:hypothetical protein